MNYNQVISTTTEICLVDNGLFCQEWQIEKTTTYNILDLGVLFLMVGITAGLIKIFLPRKPKYIKIV